MSRVFCVSCDQPIRPGEPYDTHIHHGASHGGGTTHSHRTCPGSRTPADGPAAPATEPTLAGTCPEARDFRPAH